VEIFTIWGRVPTPVNRSACVANPTYVPLGHAKFHMDQCSESPLRGENADFWPVSKTIPASLPLCGILPVTTLTTAKETT